MATSEMNLATAACVYYFGYGAMCNPTSRARRGVDASAFASAAILPDYQLTFEFEGAATVVPKEGASVHGVLMALSEEDWEKVKLFEKGYHVEEGTVIPDNMPPENGGSEGIRAHFFVMDPSKATTDKPTQERYLKIIAAGMRHHGVPEAYIQDTILSVPSVPSRKPSEFRRFPSLIEPLPLMSQSDYQELVDKHEKEYGYMIVGKRILRIPLAGFLDNGLYAFFEHHLFGQPECTWIIWNTLLDPDMPHCERKEDLTEVHSAWAEDQMSDPLKVTDGNPYDVVAIGLLSREDDAKQ